MTQPVTSSQVLQRFAESGIRTAILQLQNGWYCIIPEYGGHILGPFSSDDSPSLFWISPYFSSPTAFEALISRKDWNTGGERIWISPEIQFNVRDRGDFWNTLSLPPQMDPGSYQLEEQSEHQIHLTQTCTLQAYNLTSGIKTLRLKRVLSPTPDPLRNIPACASQLHDVHYLGYRHTTYLEDLYPNPILCAVWNLLMVNAGGQIFIPTLPPYQYADYFEPVDEIHQRIFANHISLLITGTRRFKIGINAHAITGRLGYYYQHNPEHATLIVRNFFNNPSTTYPEEPPHLPGCNGHSVHIYNDGGGFGGFGEMEVQGQPIGSQLNRTSSEDTFLTWIYTGSPGTIRKIIPSLLGITFTET